MDDNLMAAWRTLYNYCEQWVVHYICNDRVGRRQQNKTNLFPIIS